MKAGLGKSQGINSITDLIPEIKMLTNKMKPHFHLASCLIHPAEVEALLGG